MPRTPRAPLPFGGGKRRRQTSQLRQRVPSALGAANETLDACTAATGSEPGGEPCPEKGVSAAC